MVDDLRPDLGSYGHPLVQSPNIDRLAARGVRFERAYSQFPVCNPSRSSFLTGLRPLATGVLDNTTHYRKLLPDAVTLPQHFRTNGYFTASVGKVFHGAGGRNEWSNPEAWDLEAFPRGRRRARAGERERFPYREDKSIGWAAAAGRDRDQTDGQVALETVGVLEQARDRPFFVATGFLRPHTPWIAPKEYFDLYPQPALESYLAALEASAEAQPLAPGVSPDRIGREEQLALLRAYYACVSFVDAQIGLIFDALDRLELWQTTVVVLVSDHGVHLGERSWWWKNTLSEVSARVPLVISVPGLTPGGEASTALVELVDLFPTLVDLFGLPAVPNLDGRSLTPLLRDPGPDTPWKRAAFTQALRGGVAGYSVRTDRWRYAEWDQGLGAELYDHRTDPHETVNLAGDPASAPTIQELRALLQAYREGRRAE